MMKRASRRRRYATLKSKAIPGILAALATSILIFILYYVNFDISYGAGASAIIFASFGASAFILFMTPRARSARVGSFIKSYVLAAVLGIAGLYAVSFIPFYVAAGVVVFLLSMLMYATDSDHPPAIGIALAFILYRIDIVGALLVIIGVALLLFLRLVLEKFVYLVEEDVVRDIRLEEQSVRGRKRSS